MQVSLGQDSADVFYLKDGMNFIPERYKGDRTNERGTGGHKGYSSESSPHCLDEDTFYQVAYF